MGFCVGEVSGIGEHRSAGGQELACGAEKPFRLRLILRRQREIVALVTGFEGLAEVGVKLHLKQPGLCDVLSKGRNDSLMRTPLDPQVQRRGTRPRATARPPRPVSQHARCAGGFRRSHLDAFSDNVSVDGKPRTAILLFGEEEQGQETVVAEGEVGCRCRHSAPLLGAAYRSSQNDSDVDVRIFRRLVASVRPVQTDPPQPLPVDSLQLRAEFSQNGQSFVARQDHELDPFHCIVARAAQGGNRHETPPAVFHGQARLDTTAGHF